MFLDLILGLLGGGEEGGIGGIITDGISAGIADAISELFTGSAEGLSSVAE
ncbi:MAG: hypothetical protein U5N21_08205 [Rhodococcus sp. (in: high G+C Gram-positive bacteria)]|nr:hypothetical protein [Rhodococcus sp. (in: high G+C Gram-positive bacteria)]